MKEILIAISVVILIILLIIYTSRKIEDTMLRGFWTANASFCQDADLEWFVLYLGDDSGYVGHCRYSYICAANAEGIILNHPITINFGQSMCLKPGITHCKTYNITIDWHDDDPDIEDVFPSNMQLAYYPKYGKIVLYKGDTTKAILWKDLQTSAIASTDSLIPSDVAHDDGTENTGAESIGDDVDEDLE